MFRRDVPSPFYRYGRRNTGESSQAVQSKIDEVYDRIEILVDRIRKLKKRMEALKKGVRSSDNIQKILDNFDLLFERMNCEERRELCRQFIERIDVFQNERDDGRILKRIVFRFPVYYEDEGKRAENDEPDEVVTFEVDCTEHRVTASEAKATYAEIRAYVKEKYGMNVSSLYILIHCTGKTEVWSGCGKGL